MVPFAIKWHAIAVPFSVLASRLPLCFRPQIKPEFSIPALADENDGETKSSTFSIVCSCAGISLFPIAASSKPQTTPSRFVPNRSRPTAQSCLGRHTAGTQEGPAAGRLKKTEQPTRFPRSTPRSTTATTTARRCSGRCCERRWRAPRSWQSRCWYVSCLVGSFLGD